jgi:molybdopterin/thiamine biosynthesis adenylyltransferase
MRSTQNSFTVSSTWPLKPSSIPALSGADAVFRPVLFNASDPQSRVEIQSLVADGRVIQVIDTLPMQMRDLVESYHPSETPMSDVEANAHIEDILAGRSLDEYGTWVHYPWSGRLVRVLPQQEYFFLRTDRNRFRLTMEQQRTLAERKIGIAGLSVGQATALTLSMEGVGGHFKLADFDTLGLSNLNRLRAGVHNLGVNKAILAAREMYEFNPYIHVDVYKDGISEEVLDDFLLGGGRLDLLVEECDDLAMKVRLRERARELKMPVLMETSDRGMLDVERFDLEPDRPLLHGLMSGADAKALAGLPTKEKIPFFLRVVDEKRMSDPLLGSLIDIKTSISSWPQLASAVALGGAVLTDTARRLLLGQFQSSGRFYVDLSEIVNDGTAVKLVSAKDKPEPPAGSSEQPKPLPKPLPASGEIREEEIRYLVSHAILAPSGGNSQPWRFHYENGHLDVRSEEVVHPV